MPPRFSEVISDRSKYPDDARFTLAGEEITFGELRRQNAESHGAIEQQLNERQRQLDAAAAQQTQATTTLAGILENVSRVTGLSYDDLVAGRIPQNLRQAVSDATLNTRTESGALLKDDPLYKPILDGYIAPMRGDIDLLKQTLGTSIGAYKNDHTKLAFLEYQQSDDKPAGFKPKYEDALQNAVNKGYKDELGFPDVRRALIEMAGPVREKADSTKVREDGYAEGFKAAQLQFLGQVGQPSSGSGGISFDAAPEGQQGQKTQTIRQKLDEAFKDPTIAAGLFGGQTVQ